MVFSHDGLRDSLTRVAAPPYFYEILKREISLSERSKSAITAITFKLKSEPAIDDYSLLAFAEIAKRTFRLEDHIARMGENIFIVLITGDEQFATEFRSKIYSEWKISSNDEISLHFAWAIHHAGESPLDFLNRLDRQELASFYL